MAELLYLCHRIPYPPNKGDKIRAYHWLRALARRYTVHLGSFVDDSDDWAHRDTLGAWCDQLCLRELKSSRATLRSLRALVAGEALSFAYYRDRGMQAWVDRIMAERDIAAILVFSSTMAPYVVGHRHVRRILDFVDVDSDKWAQYARRSKPPMRWVYAREAKTLAAGERQLANVFDANVFVSEAEADFFRHAAPGQGEKTHAIGNGVDAAYFDPDATYSNPDVEADADHPMIVFTGAMDYGANIDAVCWFVEKVFTRIRRAVPRARFVIVGTRPARRVLALSDVDGVFVTGAVPDVRPWLAHARVAVAPMRIARGLQNKVLEALSMARPVVISGFAAAGLAEASSDFCRVADEPADYAAAVIDYLASEAPNASYRGARDYVLRHYGWDARFATLENLIEGAPARSTAEVAQETVS